ncbi:hypothetical protein C7B80_13150 [Cyanosarcina cf. burmensis CCALA 770]|nr:hypothetical protein C7B80_13150 [Cyanosarcina cf. burmensis CCALA 770]
MKLQSISESDFHQIDGSRQVIVDEYPRRFASLDLGERVGVYGLGWNSDLIEPEVVVSADGHTVWVGVDQYLTAIEVATGRIRVALKLHTNLLQILILERLTAVRTETEIFLFNPDFSIFLNKGFPNITEDISVEGDKLMIHFLDEDSLTLDLQTGRMKNGSGSQSVVKTA